MVVRSLKQARDINDSERLLLQIARDAAEHGEPLPKTDDLAEMIGVSNGGTIPEMFSRLHNMGELELISYQRGRRVCFPDGRCTALPLNTAPHWRDRPRDVPSPSRDVVTQRDPVTSVQIFKRASEMGKSTAEFLADLVFIGWQVEKDRG